MKDTPLYYECHVTLEPVKDKRLGELVETAAFYGFRVANLIMLRDGSPHEKDAFCSARNANKDVMFVMMDKFVARLKQDGFLVYRHKLEATLFDTKFQEF